MLRIRSTQTTPSAAYPPCKLNILLHDRYSFRMDCAEIRVFEQMHEESLRCFLQGLDGL